MGAPELTDNDVRKLERITGLTIHPDNLGVIGVELGIKSTPCKPIVVSVIRSHAGTVDDFLKVNLDRLRRRLSREQRWKCAQCAGIKLLQLHHIKHRSKQRDDRIENLEMLCRDCHVKEHNQ